MPRDHPPEFGFDDANFMSSADAAPRWRDGPEPPPPGDGAETVPPLPPLAGFDVVRWADHEPAEIEFAVAGLCPVGMVSLLVAQGGSGKTLLGQTALTCIAASRPFLGRETLSGSAVGLLLEDPDEVLHLRQSKINRLLGIDYEDLAGRLFVLPAADSGLVLWRGGRATPALAMLERQLGEVKALRILVIDNVALVFAGDENSRIEVSQFLSALNGLARRLKIALVLITHSSKSSDGSALRVASGSTAFVNASRSVLELKPGDGENPPRLKVVKANHAENGQEIELQWTDGMLVPAGFAGGLVASIERQTRDRQCEEAFLEVLSTLKSQNRDVCDTRKSERYAPKVMKTLDRAKGYRMNELDNAMNSLLNKGVITIEVSGPAYRSCRKIVEKCNC